MNINDPYLRTKDKYELQVIWSQHQPLVEELNKISGAYWFKTSLKFSTYEAWLTPEEKTILALKIPQIKFLKLRIDK